MEGTNSLIEVNGKTYDASSGALLSNGASEPVVDEPKKSKVISAAKPSQRQPHQMANPASAHKTQASRTLNRKSVKKPDLAMKPSIKTNRPLKSKLAKKSAANLIKLSTARIEPARAERASATKRSAALKHFQSTFRPTEVSSQQSSPNQSIKPIHPKSGRTFDITRPRPQQHSALRPAPANSAAASVSTPVPQTQFSKLVQTAEQSKQHRYLEYTPVKQRRGLDRLGARSRRLVAFSAISLAIVLLAGFIFLEEKNNIELQLADAHAGVNATLPSYQPSGFGVSHFNYRPGFVAINYKSNFGANSYKLTQKSSNLDSSALSQQLAASGQNYQTLHSAGRTIFSQASGTNTSAAWVSDGILYQIKGNSSLSNQQIISIASST